MPPRRRIGSVERAARRELRQLSRTVREGALAEAVLLLAQRLDGIYLCPACAVFSPTLTARDEATTVHELRVSLQALAVMSPDRAEDDPIDELGARRDARLAAAAGDE